MAKDNTTTYLLLAALGLGAYYVYDKKKKKDKAPADDFPSLDDADIQPEGEDVEPEPADDGARTTGFDYLTFPETEDVEPAASNSLNATGDCSIVSVGEDWWPTVGSPIVAQMAGMQVTDIGLAIITEHLPECDLSKDGADVSDGMREFLTWLGQKIKSEAQPAKVDLNVNPQQPPQPGEPQPGVGPNADLPALNLL